MENMKVQNEKNQTRKCVANVELPTLSPTMAFRIIRCENINEEMK